MYLKGILLLAPKCDMFAVVVVVVVVVDVKREFVRRQRIYIGE